jgi:hypothetical protein
MEVYTWKNMIYKCWTCAALAITYRFCGRAPGSKQDAQPMVDPSWLDAV